MKVNASLGASTRKTKRLRTLLVHMPWHAAEFPPLGVAVLKSYLRAQGRPCDVIYPSLLWARQIGLDANERLLQADFYAEWFFAYSLFGPLGTGESSFNWTGLLRGIREYRADERGRWLETIRPSDPMRLAVREVPRFLDSCLRRYAWENYDVIGFTARHRQGMASLALARMVKKRYPDKLIILHSGAGSCSNLGAGEMGLEYLRAFEWIDAVLGGESERPMLEIIRAAERGGPRGPVAGAHRRLDGRIVSGPPALPVALDDLPFPDHADYFRALAEYGLARFVTPVMTFEESRGCWWGQDPKRHCLFCSLSDTRYRAKSGRRLLRELRHLASRYGTAHFSSSALVAGKEMLSDFLPRLRRSRLDWRLEIIARPPLGRDQIRLMADAGVKDVFCGIEALSTRSLKLLGKGTLAIQNLQTLKYAKEFGINITWTFLHGIPGQDAGFDAENLATACLISHLAPSAVTNPVRIGRFSPFFDRAAQLGVRNPRPKWIYEFLFPKSRVDLNRIAGQFDHDLTDGPRQARYRVALERLVASWQQAYEQGETFLFQERLPGVLKVYDCRLRGPDDARPTFRLHLLRGLEAALYRRCGSMPSESELLAFSAKRAGCPPQAAQDSLARLKAAGLLYHEGGHYLGLALPAEAYPRPIRERAYVMAFQAGLFER